jgi:predicted metalloprotease with PDZ domain
MYFKSFVFGLVMMMSSVLAGAQTNGYTYTIDLTKIQNDRIYVELTPPSTTKNEITFYLPKIVPGTYAIADYGRYVTDFTATDKKGKKLQVEKIDENSWKIKDAKKVSKISYWVDDSWDTNVSGPEIFWPAGTNIEEGKNYVLNSSGFFGYFEDQKEVPYKFNVVRPKDLYGSTGLVPVQAGVPITTITKEKVENAANKVVDVYQASDYDQLIDSPLMYAKPDTAIIKVANTAVLIGSYSPNNKVTAEQIAESIQELLMAQKEYLGGELPVNKYAFIFYFTDKPVLSYGALEHSYSSMYYMPEQTIDEMKQGLRDMAAHEFFHIVTPLTVHAEQIENFDYNTAKLSEHLWMYEGVTEFFAGDVQLKQGLISPEQYIQMLQEKMFQADEYKNDLSFTEMSKFAADKHHDQYNNVYAKGALIGFVLDIKLRKLSEGKYSLVKLMMDLSKKYGKNKPFKDEELFDEITKMTYPEIGEFFKNHVQGTEPLPLKETFADLGIIYEEEYVTSDYTLGIDNDNISVALQDGNQKLQITSVDKMNPMGKALGFQAGDILLKINGDSIPDLNSSFGPFIQGKLAELQEGKNLSYTVLRKDGNGNQKEVQLTAPAQKVEVKIRHYLSPSPTVTPEQMALRQMWLRPESNP